MTPAILRSVEPRLAARVQEGKQVVPHSGSRGGPCTLHLLSRPLHCPGLDAILLPSGPRLGLHPLLTPSGPQLPPWSPASSGAPDPDIHLALALPLGVLEHLKPKPAWSPCPPQGKPTPWVPPTPSPSGRPQLPLDSSCPLPTSSPAEATELHPMAQTLPNLLGGLWFPGGSSPGTEAIFQKRHP